MKRCLILLTVLCTTTIFANNELDRIKMRISPIGKINIAPVSVLPASSAAPATTQPIVATVTTGGDIGKKIYDSKCVICHGTGIAGAPKFANKADWEPRTKQGMNVLLTHVEQGYKAMPAKGTCTECTDADLKKAIEYMLKNSQITL
jgi:cytochrome c5